MEEHFAPKYERLASPDQHFAPPKVLFAPKYEQKADNYQQKAHPDLLRAGIKVEKAMQNIKISTLHIKIIIQYA